MKDLEENGAKSLHWWMIKFGEGGHPVFRATSPLSRGMLNSIGGKKKNCTLLCRKWYDWHFFRTIISVNQVSIYEAVSDLCEEFRSCQTGRPVVAEQSDPHFAPADLLVKTHTPSIEIAAQENLLQKHKERVEKLPQPDRLIENLYWCRIPEKSCSRTTHHDKKTLTSSCNVQRQWHVVRNLYHEMIIQLTRKVGFRETPKLDPYWKSQAVTCKVNTEWNSELNLWTKTISTRGSEFLMAWTNWSQTWSTRSTKTTRKTPPLRIFVCKPIQS